VSRNIFIKIIGISSVPPVGVHIESAAEKGMGPAAEVDLICGRYFRIAKLRGKSVTSRDIGH